MAEDPVYSAPPNLAMAIARFAASAANRPFLEEWADLLIFP